MALRFGITFFRSVEPDEKDAATYDDEALAKVSFDRIPVAAAR